MLKILLVEPPKLLWPLLDDTALPPVGLACLAAYLRQEHIPVQVLDSMYPRLSLEQVREAIRDKHPDIVGITAETYNANAAHAVARMVKEDNPNTVTIGGGSYLTLNWEPSLQLPYWDFIVLGEGEQTLVELYHVIEQGADPASVRGIAYRQGEEVVKTAPRPLIEDLDSLPMPAWDLFEAKMRHYKLILLGDHDVTVTTTSRGCSYDCNFCTERILWGGRWRARSARKIVDEMALLKSYGKRVIWFGDDTFNIDRKRMIDLCVELEKRRLNMQWSIEVRSDLLYRDLDLIPRLKRCGLFWAMVGVEFSDESEIAYYGKHISIEQTRKVFQVLREHDIISQAMFIMGTFNETRRSIENKYVLARELDADFTIFTPMTPYPGTPVHQQAQEAGLIVDHNLDHYNFIDVVMKSHYLSAAEIDYLIRMCYRRFYGRMWRNLRYLFARNHYRRNLIWHFIKYSYKSFTKELRARRRRLQQDSGLPL